MNQTCVKHKLPISLMCVFIGCKKQRLMCYKCNSDHKLHSENILQIDNFTEKMTKDYQDSSMLSNKNNIQGVSSYNSSSEINGSPFLLNNLAHLSLRSNSSGKGDQNLKKSSVKNLSCKVSEFKSNGNYEDMVAQNRMEELQKNISYNINLDYRNENEQSVQKEWSDNLVMKEETIEDEEFQNSKTDSNQLQQCPEQKYNNNIESRYSKDSVFTRILGNDCISMSCKLPTNSQKLSQHSSQTITTPSLQTNNPNPIGQSDVILNVLHSPPLHPPRLPFEGPYQFGSHFHQNQQMMLHPNYPPNHLSPHLPPMFGQQNHFNPLSMPPTGYIPYPPYPHHSQSNSSKVLEKDSLCKQIPFVNGDQKENSLSDKPNRNGARKDTDSINTMNNNVVEKIENDQFHQKNQFQNEIFYEVIKQNENIQKICIYLRSLNEIKISLCAKIDRIKSTFLQSIQMKEEDFSYAFLADSFIKSNSLVEERIKNYFNKIQHLNQFFEKNQIIYNPSATSRQKQFQLEQELDRILSFAIEKIDPEKQKEAKKLQQSQVDPFKNKTEYNDLIQYYQDQPAKIEVLKDKINFFNQYQLEFDGTSKGNPGRSGSGFLIRDTNTDKSILEYSVEVGTKTSNQAEYLSLIYGMYACHKLGIRLLRIQGDSEVVIKHMQGVYQCRSVMLKDYYNLAKSLDELFHSKEYVHVKREFNTEADALANSALI